jgi:hypothetical protein
VDVWEIRTPTHMRGALGNFARTHFLAVPDELEPDVRATASEIFDDYTLIEPEVDPPGLVDSYLESIAGPLARLRALGMQLVVVQTSGTIEIAGTTMQGTQNDLLVAPSPCWFRREGDASDPVHVLGARCNTGHRVFAESHVAVELYRSREAIEQAFERAAPWCPTCAMADVEAR